MILSLMFAFMMKAEALPLEVLEVEYRPPASSPSCGLLRRREVERLKVLRELNVLTRKAGQIGKNAPDPSVYAYWESKYFMPPEVWAEDTTEVRVAVRTTEELRAQISAQGLGAVFLTTEGPGFVWQSYADQLPPGMSVSLEGDSLAIRYHTYLNEFCAPTPTPASVEWTPPELSNVLTADLPVANPVN